MADTTKLLIDEILIYLKHPIDLQVTTGQSIQTSLLMIIIFSSFIGLIFALFNKLK